MMMSLTILSKDLKASIRIMDNSLLKNHRPLPEIIAVMLLNASRHPMTLPIQRLRTRKVVSFQDILKRIQTPRFSVLTPVITP